MHPRLYRSRNDRYVAGVCGGLAQTYGWDPTSSASSLCYWCLAQDQAYWST